MLLAGDIGGTKTELGIFSSVGGPHTPIAHTKVHSVAYPDLEAIVKEFLLREDKPVDRAYFAAAGPVIDGQVRATNLSWVIDERALALEMNLNQKSVRVMNDLEAIASAVPILRPRDVETLNSGVAAPMGAIAVIAPGTGLGESFLTWDGNRYRAHGSEGGHTDFAPTDPQQIRLLEFMSGKFKHVSFERVCSGIGLPLIYEFLRDVEGIPEPRLVKELFTFPGDPSSTIIENAVSEDPSDLCSAAVDLLVSILAAEASNLALKVMATGGVYLAGGVAVHALPVLRKPAFLQAFTRKGRFSDLMSRVPIHVVLNSAALTGAAARGLADQ